MCPDFFSSRVLDPLGGYGLRKNASAHGERLCTFPRDEEWRQYMESVPKCTGDIALSTLYKRKPFQQLVPQYYTM